MIKVYFANTAIIQKADPDCLKSLLSPESKSRLAGLKRDVDKNLLLTSSVLLAQMLFENGYENYKACNLQYNTTGRPFFPDSPFDFNISHTDNCAAVVFSESCRVGMDIEKIKEVDLLDFENIFSKEVWNIIHSSGNKIRKFYYYWTQLESAIKADGRGLSLVPSGNIEIRDDRVLIDGTSWFSHHNDICTAISCCIASDKEEKNISFRELNSLFGVEFFP
ncbi:MAG: 4'-phosphopantetheinyl transferase [uncultured bacterium]|nr:MAG: 4'-phosphopantetheinyl transferase [uncultured bacterium]HBY02738.1 hypothetical protein [Rikenellaceae bacterium]